MCIGILTFHSQLNYGGVLQCWALQNALTHILNEKCERCGGRDGVVVIDRWLSPDNQHLERGYNHWSRRDWVRMWVRSLFGCEDYVPWLRPWRTKRFVKSLGLTPYHFYDWKDAPKDLGVDCLVVGSDQVWHGGKGTWAYPTPAPYLLQGAPRLPAIAYAASFGMRTLPSDVDYVAGFKRFAAISVREAEGVKLVESAGGKAVHVVDPTLLLPREAWRKLGTYRKRPRNVVCYCLVENLEEQLSAISAWAERTDRNVTIISERMPERKSFPKTPAMLIRRLKDVVVASLKRPRVRVVVSYGPREFYRAFAEADECITNSFHAVMFSYICKCNVRFLRPSTAERQSMFARIEEFGCSSVSGNFIVDGLWAALDSLDNDPRVSFNESAITSRRDDSVNWLKSSLNLK